MELTSLEGLTLGNIIAGLLGAAILVAIGRFFTWANSKGIGGRLLFLAINKFFWRTLLTAALSFGFAITASALPLSIAVNVPLVSAVTFSMLLAYTQWKFAAVGLHTAQLSVEHGTSYRAALNLCKNHFSLLGTGAFKLTQQNNFKETMLRCKHDVRPVRLLLSNPDNEIIAEAERKANVAKGTYKLNLIKSLKTLKRLHEENNLKFQVRFYKGETESDFENFRMMFIDDDTLLLSYNVYGSGDGRQTAQLVLFKSNVTSSTDNFYFAYQNYFERLWATSEVWDFAKYI